MRSIALHVLHCTLSIMATRDSPGALSNLE